MKYMGSKSKVANQLVTVIQPYIEKFKPWAYIEPFCGGCNVIEVFEDEDECYGDEGVYEPLEYYKDRRNRMKGEGKGKDTCDWWLASAHSGDSYIACTVGGNGNAGYNYVTNPYIGVPLCFQIQKS